MRVGDVIVTIDARPVASVDDIHRALQKWPIVSALKLGVVRERRLVELEVVPVEAA
jgi:S1-C subfamily serine protease